MAVVFLILVVLVVLGAALVLVGRWDASLADSGRPARPPLPPQPWRADDIRTMEFRVGLRGYRMEDVDEMLRHLAAQLEVAEADSAATEQSPPAAEQRD